MLHPDGIQTATGLQTDNRQIAGRPQPESHATAGNKAPDCGQFAARLQPDRGQSTRSPKPRRRHTACAWIWTFWGRKTAPFRVPDSGPKIGPGCGYLGTDYYKRAGNWTRFGCRNPAPKLVPDSASDLDPETTPTLPQKGNPSPASLRPGYRLGGGACRSKHTTVLASSSLALSAAHLIIYRTCKASFRCASSRCVLSSQHRQIFRRATLFCVGPVVQGK